jgi:mannose-6-phosphate isomerase-like protein (cupin superfamily)
MAIQPLTAPPSPTAFGQPRWFFGMLAEVRASAAHTAGQYTLVEITAPAGLEAPLHVHYTEDEGFYVLEGSVTIVVGNETVELAPGQHAFGPREVPHKFTVGPEGARMIWVLTPGGFENLIDEASVPATARAVPPPSVVPPDNIAEILRRHGNDVLPG